MRREFNKNYLSLLHFDFPYFATSINDFWKRWHISLTSWFRDYLYISLGGNRCSKFRHCCNIMTVFLVSGLWHGANWTFITWGGLHGLLQLLENAIRGRKPLPYVYWLSKAVGGIFTFVLVSFCWIFFRAPNFSTAFLFIKGIFCWKGGLSFGISFNTFAINMLMLLIFGILDVWYFMHWANNSKETTKIWIRSLKYSFLISLIAMFGQSSGGFIYQHF